MIFNIGAVNLRNDESYKERNLYYKIFAGYLFNEIIPGIKIRKESFFKKLEDVVSIGRFYYRAEEKDKEIINIMLKEIKNADLHLTFDYHLAQLDGADRQDSKNREQIFVEEDRGEMSDILLITKNHMISIECKFLSNFTFEKDIKMVQSRMQNYISHFKKEKRTEALQILLLNKSKWNNSKQINKLKSYQLLFPLVILFWDEIESLIKDKRVSGYLNLQIGRK